MHQNLCQSGPFESQFLSRQYLQTDNTFFLIGLKDVRGNDDVTFTQ